MREILFRGKRIDNGEWVYGSLQIGERDGQATDVWVGTCVFNPGGLYEPPGWDQEDYEVNPATVGQYIGKKDRSGKRIFEGDVVETIRYQKYAPGGFTYEPDRFYIKFFTGGFQLTNKWRWVSLLSDASMEVIGNIHDNPELMEGGVFE